MSGRCTLDAVDDFHAVDFEVPLGRVVVDAFLVSSRTLGNSHIRVEVGWPSLSRVARKSHLIGSVCKILFQC